MPNIVFIALNKNYNFIWLTLFAHYVSFLYHNFMPTFRIVLCAELCKNLNEYFVFENNCIYMYMYGVTIKARLLFIFRVVEI